MKEEWNVWIEDLGWRCESVIVFLVTFGGGMVSNFVNNYNWTNLKICIFGTRGVLGELFRGGDYG